MLSMNLQILAQPTTALLYVVGCVVPVEVVTDFHCVWNTKYASEQMRLLNIKINKIGIFSGMPMKMGTE